MVWLFFLAFSLCLPSFPLPPPVLLTDKHVADGSPTMTQAENVWQGRGVISSHALWEGRCTGSKRGKGRKRNDTVDYINGGEGREERGAYKRRKKFTDRRPCKSARPEAEFLDEIQTKFTVTSKALSWDSISSNSRNLLQFLEFIYCTL